MSQHLTLQLSEKTLKKLRALAMLSGSTVDELEKQFAEYFDQMLSESIAAHLSELDGKPYDSRMVAPVVPQALQAEAQEEVEQEREDEIDTPEHGLSEDELPEEVKSAAEMSEDEIMPPQYQAPSAGGNADAFLDAALASDRPAPQTAQQVVSVSGMTGTLRAAGKGFNPSRPRASVAEFTGDN